MIYFAGPLFCDAECSFNSLVANRLEESGFHVFLPQRDGVESNKEPYSSMTKEERRELMFTTDRDKVFAADVFLFILDGRVPDEGACVELGMAYCQKHLTNANKIIVGLQTDKRAAFIAAKLNPMLKLTFDFIAVSVEELVDWLSKQVECTKDNL